MKTMSDDSVNGDNNNNLHNPWRATPINRCFSMGLRNEIMSNLKLLAPLHDLKFVRSSIAPFGMAAFYRLDDSFTTLTI